MTIFARRIHPSRLTEETVDTHAWFRELLRLWRPAGVPSDKDDQEKISSLRLAVRKDYLSFYNAGQQAALVRCTSRLFREEVHHEYLRVTKPANGYYIKVTSTAEEEANAELARRLARISKWHGEEKIFVDEVVGANPNIFDLELALSHQELDATRPVALRLDAAALEPHAGGWKIALWEAKRAADTRARAVEEPKTMAQHKAYADWLNREENAEAFIKATRETCRLLLRLRELALQAGNTDIAPLGAGITAIGENPDMTLTIERNVRYVIDARSDERGTFVNNGHDVKLRDHTQGHVQVISKGDSLILDAL